MTLRLATIGLHGTMFVADDHLFAFVQALRIEGYWADWLPHYMRQRLVKFGRLLATERDDPMFASSYLNPVRRLKLGPRAPSLMAGNPHLLWIENAFETWLDQNVAMTKKGPRQALRLMCEFLITVPETDAAPEQAFCRKNVKSLLAFAADWSTPLNRQLAIYKLLDFAEWYCHEHAPPQGLTPSFELTRYDVEQFMKAMPPVPSRRGEVAARPMPARFHHMLKQILLEDDFAWPKSLLQGQTKLPVHWFPWTDPTTKKVESVFCEVLPRMLLLQLELPLRNVQVRRLDSGEGDEREYDTVSNTWRDARGPLAGYWKKHRAKNPHRGIVCTAKARLTVPLVQEHYAGQNGGEEIGESTLRNKRAAGNPYRSLYRKWEAVAEAKVAASLRRITSIGVGSIAHSEVDLIEDPILRAKVTMLMAQAKSTERQLNTLKQERTDVPLRIEGIRPSPGSANLLLSSAEVEAVRDFADPRSLKAKHLERTKENGVKMIGGRIIADPGFATALEKIVRSYDKK